MNERVKTTERTDSKMRAKRRRFDPAFKAKIGLEALKGVKTVVEIAREYQVHPNQVSQWKSEVVQRLPEGVRAWADGAGPGAGARDRAAGTQDGPTDDGVGLAQKKVQTTGLVTQWFKIGVNLIEGCGNTCENIERDSCFSE
jgi:transposase-like protein